MIHVVILDENDHAPEFERPTINVSLSEGAALGTVVETVRAVDGDAVDPTSLAKDKVSFRARCSVRSDEHR